MKIFVNKVHFPVTALGPGKRLGVWLQGCSIGCRGCISRDTWAAHPAHETTVEALLEHCNSLAPGEIDGVTISGGEPFEQPEALHVLLRGLAARRSRQEAPLDLLAYSGLPIARLRRDFATVLDRLDAVISEPFAAAKAPGGPWRGSSNQTLTAFTDLGRRRYADGGVDGAPGGRIQISVDDDSIWFIGIPGPGDMQRIEQAARARGLRLGEASWRA